MSEHNSHYLTLGRLLSIDEADKTLERISKSAPPTKTNEQLNNAISLNDYQTRHPIRGFLKSLYYNLTGKI